MENARPNCRRGDTGPHFDKGFYRLFVLRPGPELPYVKLLFIGSKIFWMIWTLVEQSARF
jgi:hypothetical protein